MYMYVTLCALVVQIFLLAAAIMAYMHAPYVNAADNFLQIVVLLSLVGLLGITNTDTSTELNPETGQLPLVQWKVKDSLTVLIMCSVAAVAFWTTLSKYITAFQIKIASVIPDAMLDAYGNLIGEEEEEVGPNPYMLPGEWTEKMVKVTTSEVVTKDRPYYIKRNEKGHIIEKSWVHPNPPPLRMSDTDIEQMNPAALLGACQHWGYFPDGKDTFGAKPSENTLRDRLREHYKTWETEDDKEQFEMELEEEEMMNPLARALDTDPWRRLEQLEDDPEALRMVEEAKRTRAQKLAARCAKLSADIPQQSLPEVLVVGALEGMEPGQLIEELRQGRAGADVIIQRLQQQHAADEALREELNPLEVKPLQRWIAKRNFSLTVEDLCTTALAPAFGTPLAFCVGF